MCEGEQELREALRAATEAAEQGSRDLDSMIDRAMTAEEDAQRYRDAIGEALKMMMNVTDHELGEGGIARKAYAHLYHAYFLIPADRRRSSTTT